MTNVTMTPQVPISDLEQWPSLNLQHPIVGESEEYLRREAEIEKVRQESLKRFENYSHHKETSKGIWWDE